MWVFRCLIFGVLSVGIAHLALGQQRAYVATSFPRNDAVNLACNTFLKATIHFPSESKRLDPATLGPRSLKLYAEGKKDQLLPFEYTYEAESRLLLLRPKTLFEAHTTYVFEVTTGLVDDRGFSVLPHRLHFTTGTCPGDAISPPLSSRGEEAEAEEPVTLPIPKLEMESLRLEDEQDSVRVLWKTLNEFMYSDFTIDRSTDGKEFSILDRVPSQGDSHTIQEYAWVDHDAPLGASFYRLSLIDLYGELTHSDTVSLFRRAIRFDQTELRQGGSLSIHFVVPKKTTLALVIKNRAGKIVKRKAGFVESGHHTYTVALEGLERGRYLAILRTAEEVLPQEITIQ